MGNTATLVASLTSFGITVFLGLLLIPALRRMKFGQTIREDGPSWHKSKQGTPTMGGIMFVAGISLATIFGYTAGVMSGQLKMNAEETVMLFAGLAMAILFASIGFVDDWIKVARKRNLGLTAIQKILLQILVTAAYLTVIHTLGGHSTAVNIPFLGTFDFGILYFPIMGILIIGIVNSANLTDGIDGLCTSVTFVIAVFFMLASSYMAMFNMAIMATALAAGCIAFLVFNMHPAKVFMGDTGSFFFGGITMALGFGIDMEFILLFVGFIYCCESLSVILQVISVKTRGKRIFKMSPIHHHFEMCGWKEGKIVATFSLITIIMCSIAFVAIKLFVEN